MTINRPTTHPLIRCQSSNRVGQQQQCGSIKFNQFAFDANRAGAISIALSVAALGQDLHESKPKIWPTKKHIPQNVTKLRTFFFFAIPGNGPPLVIDSEGGGPIVLTNLIATQNEGFNSRNFPSPTHYCTGSGTCLPEFGGVIGSSNNFINNFSILWWN